MQVFLFANYPASAGSGVLSVAARIGSLLGTDIGWKDIEWLRGLWDRPLLIKGILHSGEARQAVALGVDGIVVSNHGGRQLDAVPASVEAFRLTQIDRSLLHRAAGPAGN
jgi:isopentenyl diphosphate isomerase/L-lactate dehydrogenase-like FMN-dependent dehydrogenase